MSIHYSDDQVTLHHGDSLAVLRTLPDASVNSCVTSPPYFGLRDYGEPGQYGLEASPVEYVETMRALFAEVRRVLADDGTLWLNLGDSYSTGSGGDRRIANPNDRWSASGAEDRSRARDAVDGLDAKNLLMIPETVALALRSNGWILRNKIIWEKPNAMPESVTDRLSCRYEQVFLFSKAQRYWFDLDPIREPLTYPDAADGTRVFGGKNKGNTGGVDSTLRRRGGKPWTRTTTPQTATDQPAMAADGSTLASAGGPGPAQLPSEASSSSAAKADPAGRNPGDVWSISTQPFPEAHFAVMAPKLAERCILAGCKPGGTVLDPFSGVGTTGMVAQRHGRKYVGIDISAATLDLSLRTRLQQAALDFEAGDVA